MTKVGNVDMSAAPATPVTRWRLRSRSCAVADVIAAAAGLTLFIGSAVDSVASWPSNRVLLGDPDLSRAAEVLLMPSWLWLVLSVVMVSGLKRRRRRDRRFPQWPWPASACFAVAGVVCAAVIAGGFAVGAAKGAVRVLPGPRYLVSTLDINNAAWTAVPAAQFNLWEARFVREDGFFTLFGLILVWGCLYLLWLHRSYGRSDNDDPGRGAPAKAQG